MTTITREQAQKIIDAADEVITALAGTNEDVHPESDNMLRLWDDLNDRYAPPEVVRELARIALASLEREQIRREHAEWSDATFGNVGPVGTLKHLSKEALEAAADPSDPLEWADMQFLLWDAQRRMGISDNFITRAMVEKLAVNKQREWPEPKDGEPRLHIKEQTAPVVPDDGRAEFEAWMLKKWGRERQEYDFAMGKFLHGENYADSYTRHMWKAWTESRAAMLQSKYRDLSQPVDPQISEYEKIMLRAGWVMVPVEPTDEMIAAAMNCEDVLFNSDESFCVQYREIYCAMVDTAPALNKGEY